MKKIEEKYYKVWLTLIKNLGFKRYINLMEKFKNHKAIFNASKEELQEVPLIDEKMAESILDVVTRKRVLNHLKYMQANNIDIIAICDKEYPYYLREIYSPPICLYIKGDKSILNGINIGIVGCRDCTKYGIEVAKDFAYNLAKKNLNIVSGLAKGIDAYAHGGAVLAKGKTIAVLGNGLDTIYPEENRNLANKIINLGGAIISEYPLGTKPEKANFPARNRIISGMSKGIIVVEAKKKSGTIITVDFALEQGRDVFVVPGNINSPNSEGTNELIKQGARLVTSFEDVLEELWKKNKNPLVRTSNQWIAFLLNT